MNPMAQPNIQPSTSLEESSWATHEDALLLGFAKHYGNDWGTFASFLHKFGYPRRSVDAYQQRWSYLTKHTHQTTHHTTPANATPSAVPAGLAPVQTLRPPSTTSSPAHPDRNKPTTSKTAAQSSGYQQTMVPLSAVHAVLPRMLQHVLDLACEKDYPEESLHFLGGCLSASQTHLHAFLDNVLLQAAQQGLSTRSATPRGVETPPNPSASRPSATKPAGMSHSILSTQQQQQQQQQRRAPTAAPPHNSTKQVIVQGTTGTAWGMQDKDGRPLLVRKTVGAMLEERKAYKAARMAMQHSVAGSKQ